MYLESLVFSTLLNVFNLNNENPGYNYKCQTSSLMLLLEAVGILLQHVQDYQKKGVYLNEWSV